MGGIISLTCVLIGNVCVYFRLCVYGWMNVLKMEVPVSNVRLEQHAITKPRYKDPCKFLVFCIQKLSVDDQLVTVY